MKQDTHLPNYIFYYIVRIDLFRRANFDGWGQTSFARSISFMERTSLKIKQNLYSISDFPQNSTFLQAISVLNDFWCRLRPKKVFIPLNTCGL